MIYLKNNTETQSIYIPRQTVLGSGYIATTEKYEEGYNDGFKDGKEQQKSKLESINITENGTYSREDGYNEIVVEVPDLNGSYDEGYEQGKTEGEQEGYKQGQADIAANARVLNVTENGIYRSKFSDPIPPTLVTGIYADGTKFHNYAELNGKVFNTKIAATENSRLEFWYKGDNTINGSGWNLIIGAGNFDDTSSFQVRYFAFNNDSLCIESASRVIINGWDDTVWHHLIVSETEGIWIDGEKKGDFPISDIINGEFFINGIGYDSDGGRTANGSFGMIKIDDVIIIPTADGFQNVNTGELLQVVKDGNYTFTENLPTYAEGELYKTINVNVPDLNGSYDEGYNQGKTDGISEQKSKLEAINITENGTYSREDGYNHIEVNVPDLNGSYNEGYDQGKADIVANARDIEVTENGQYGDGETLYKAINVNVVPKVNVQKTGIKFGKSIFTEVPEWADFKGVKDMSNMFYECIYLKTIPLIDTSNVTNMSFMFYDCRSLQTIPLLNTSNVKDMQYMFGYCNLQTIPLLNTSNVTTMENMFFNCSNLQTIPQIDTSNVTTMESMFSSCTSLVSIPALNAQKLSMNKYSGVFGYVSLSKLTDFGGLLNLKCSLANDYSFKSLPNLTYESCINVLNGLYDFTGNGETPNSNQGKLKVHQNFLDKVGEEISIGVAKGWTITA